jgi:hypothetical protein
MVARMQNPPERNIRSADDADERGWIDGKGMDGRLQPKTELRIELKGTKPAQGRGLVVTALQSANIREIRGKDCLRE